MNITLSVRVNKVGYGLWGGDVVEKEVKIETAQDSDLGLPWAQICAGLVESAIKERLAADDSEEENETFLLVADDSEEEDEE